MKNIVDRATTPARPFRLLPARTLMVAAALAVVTVQLPAQLQFDELPRRGLPVDTDGTLALALGDVDGDGDLDIVCGNQPVSTANGQNRLYVNDGAGAFTDITALAMPVDNDSTRAVALGDVDGDGDLDLVCANDTQNRLYLNGGAGAFSDMTAANMPGDSDQSRGVALGDVDGDGDLDLAFGNVAGQRTRLYINNGVGVFTDMTVTQMPIDSDFTNAVVLVDVDADGDLDMVLGNGAFFAFIQPNKLYINNGSGVFTDVTAAQLPGNGNVASAAVAGDIDGDSDIDLVIGSRLHRNDGAGSFTDVTATQLPASAALPTAMALRDFDGDGDLDLFGGASGQSRLYDNNGTGTFTDVTAGRLPSVSYATMTVAAGDIDRDGDFDVVLGNRTALGSGQQNRLYLGLHRQLHAPADLQIGQTYTLDAYMRYGPVGQGTFALPAVSFLPALPPTSVPPYGMLGLAQPLIALPLISISQPAGMGSLNLAIPNLPNYLGIMLYSQALLVPFPLLASLSNVQSDVLQ